MMQNKRKFVTVLKRSLYIVWTLLLSAVLSVIVERMYAYAEYTATQEAITSANKDLAYRTWVASHGGVYVPVDKTTQPSPFLAHIKDRDFHAIGKDFTLMNPAYTLSQMMHDYSKLYGVKTHITSQKLLNPNNKPDSWEKIALQKIEKTRENYIELNPIHGKEYLRLMKPLITQKSCLKCHAFQGYKVGDIRGGVSVSIPMESLNKDAAISSLYVAVLFVLIWLVGILFIAYFTKRIYKYIDEKELLYEEYIYGLVSVVEKRDTYTAGHSTRVADYAESIAQEMGFSQESCETLHRAGMLHDIGKIAIPDSVFLKPSKLTKGEYQLIQEHVEMSYDMLKNISIFDEIKEIVRDHHEHFDGSGYPRGLKGAQTPMLAQILMLADSFDAMTTDRIYKGRKSVQEALQEIESLGAKQFNPEIVPVALKVLQDITIEDSSHQNPETLLEKERFSYFYKDPLTDVYNEEYLRRDIHHISHCKIICWISLENFHQYNKEHGWHLGDKLLKQVASIIRFECHESVYVYRFYGDNFFVLLSSEEEVEELKKKLKELLDGEKLSFALKTSYASGLNKENIRSLEDVLKKLF